MAAQSLREQEVRKALSLYEERSRQRHVLEMRGLQAIIDSIQAPTPAQQWLANVKIPAADEGER